MNLLGYSLQAIRSLLQKKQISSEEIYSFFQKRIEKYDPDIHAYLTTIPYSKQTGKGILNDIPLAIKDNFCTQGTRTTASAKVLDTFIPPYDATVVSRIKNAGGYFLGKTNMDAWAHGSSTETSDYGPTKNPWDIKRVPGGSSGGSAAAVSAYLCPAAIGSETAGSIRQPASWCGIVGLKPTYGRVSRYGVIAMGSSLDCPGPMANYVEDAALLLDVIAGKDQFDATSSDMPNTSFASAVHEKKKLTIGIADDYFEGVEPEIAHSVHNAIHVLEQLGHTIKKISLISPKYAISDYTIIQRAEVSSNLARYDGIRYGNDRSYFSAEAKRRMMMGTYTLSYGYYDAFYKKAQKVRTKIIQDFESVFHLVDVIAAPTTPITALMLGESHNYPFFGEIMDVLTEPAAMAGIPAINIPCGLDSKNLPIGLQFMGKQFHETTILQLAYQYEKETNFYDIREKIFKKYQ